MPAPVTDIRIALTNLPSSTTTPLPSVDPAFSTTVSVRPSTAVVVQPPSQASADSQTDTWTKCYRALKLSCAAAIAILGMTAAYWTLMVTWWTAEKDFRDDCRSQNATIGPISAACLKALQSDLQAPPIPSYFLDKRSEENSYINITNLAPRFGPGHQWNGIIEIIIDWDSIVEGYEIMGGLHGWSLSPSRSSYYDLRRPSSTLGSVVLVTVACLMCPILYWCLRAKLLRSHRWNTVSQYHFSDTSD